MVYIVGVGPGSFEYIIPEAIRILSESNIILGFSRVIDSLDKINTKKVKVSSLKELVDKVNELKEDENISIVASGDPTFYGITNFIKNNYSGNLKVIPGISSFQYLTCKIGVCWNNSYVGSLHGRDDDFINKVNENKLSIWLTDKRNNPQNLCKILLKESINCKVVVGENLSYENERILIGKPDEIVNEVFSDLSIFIVERED